MDFMRNIDIIRNYSKWNSNKNKEALKMDLEM